MNVLFYRCSRFEPFLIVIHDVLSPKPVNYLPDVACNNYPNFVTLTTIGLPSR